MYVHNRAQLHLKDGLSSVNDAIRFYSDLKDEKLRVHFGRLVFHCLLREKKKKRSRAL